MTPAVDLPEEFNASTAFLDRNLEQGRGDRVAIYAGDDRITYRTLLAQVNRAGNALRSLGVHAEERVLLLMLDSPELAYLFWGAIRIGAVAVPTCTALTTRDYAYMLRDSRAGVVVVSEALLPVLEPALADLPAVRHVVVAGAPGKADRIEEWTNGRGRHALADLMAAASPELVPAATHRDEPAFWLWSSGSTGAPKGTVHLHHDMVVTAEHYARAVLDIREHDICLSIAKLFFAYGLGNALYFPFRVGAAAVLYPGRVGPGSSGEVVPGYGVKIVGEDGREVPPGEIGDLLVSGDSIASGYWNKHERTKQAFRGDWFVSGDKYYRDPEGYHWYCGRSDDMLKAGGQWVSPAEVEAALIQHPAVLECGVVGRADRDELVKPYAFVVLKPGHRADDALAEELQAFVRSKIAAYKYPRWIEFTPELPKTATGKIQRFRLRERLAERQPQAPVG